MAKIIVTHRAPDFDAITSVWLIKRFLPGWENAKLAFVPAGQKLPGHYAHEGEAIETLEKDEVIHVDTGMGVLDHHQFQDETLCAASLTFEFVQKSNDNTLGSSTSKIEAIKKIIDQVIDEDHFQQVYHADSDSYVRELTIVGILDGRKLQTPAYDDQNTEFGMECLDALVITFQSRVEAELAMESGTEFTTKWGPAIAFETTNDSVMKLAQIKGYSVVVRHDPASKLLRIKALPRKRKDKNLENAPRKEVDIDLTPIYELLKAQDPYASWFLHASKRMLLNGSAKNPNTIPTKVPLVEVIELLKSAK